VVTKSIIFWDLKLCSLLRWNRRFGGTNRLHLQGRRKILAKYIFFDPEDGGDVFLQNVGCISTEYTASHPIKLYSSSLFLSPLTQQGLLTKQCEALTDTGLKDIRTDDVRLITSVMVRRKSFNTFQVQPKLFPFTYA
jgi:hypothetical protein